VDCFSCFKADGSQRRLMLPTKECECYFFPLQV
jgi:hypothetical protein